MQKRSRQLQSGKYKTHKVIVQLTLKGARERQERRQATDFKEAACCPSAVVQRAALRKNGLCEGSARGNWDPREGQQPFPLNPNEVVDRTTTLRRLLIGATSSWFLFFTLSYLAGTLFPLLIYSFQATTSFHSLVLGFDVGDKLAKRGSLLKSGNFS